ncbi:MAG: FAD-binding oxidoreductase [Cytophagales bacterium]|nr:FAD-binding oxidoreductase [Cytophagales bacterium]
MLTNWNLYPKINVQTATPRFLQDLTRNTKLPRTFIARGLGRSYGDASLAPKVLATERLNKILRFNQDTGVLQCQAGVSLDDILKLTVPKGWFLPVTPGTKFITVGGAIASNVHGKNHHVSQSFGSHLLQIEIIDDARRMHACSPEENRELFEATCGGMGLTGIIYSATMQLIPIETAYIRQTTLQASNIRHFFELFEKFQHSTYSVGWIDCLKKGKSAGRGALMVGEHAAASEIKKKNLLRLHRPPKLRIPFTFPSFVLNGWSIRLFNFLFFHKTPKKKTGLEHYEPFFYPLDKILEWNKMYGKKGFIQYQFVLPLKNKEGIIEILEKISQSGQGSFLAVLKLFGKQEQGILSFPTEGYTLALDFPIKKGLFQLLDELDALVEKHEGRLYLAKDARMKKEFFQSSYSSLPRFLKALKKTNSKGKFKSMLSERLGLDQEEAAAFLAKISEEKKELQH